MASCISNHFTRMLNTLPKQFPILYILADANSLLFSPFLSLFSFFYFSLLFLKGASTPSGSTWRSTAIFKMVLYGSQKRWARFFFGILLIVLGIGENRYARTVSIHYIMEYVLHLLIIHILFCISEKDIKMDAL